MAALRIDNLHVVRAIMRANHTLHDREGSVMPDALDKQIEAFDRLLPSIRKQKGGTWVVIARGELQDTFTDFSKAAIYAEEHFPDEQVLIRNTEAKEEFAPFILMSVAD